MPAEQVHPWLWLKLLMVSVVFLGLNALFYWGLFFQSDSTPELIAPILEFTQEAPLVISGVTGQENTAQATQMLFMGDEIQSQEGFVELVMGRNRVRLGPNTQVELLEIHFNPQSSYAASAPAMVLNLKQGELWVKAFDLIQVKTSRQQINLSQSLAYSSYQEGVNELTVFTGVGDLTLLSEEGESLNQLNVPLLTQVYFLDAQLSKDFTTLKPSKLKKELKFSGIQPSELEDPWITFHRTQDSLILVDIRPIYSGFHFQLRNIGNAFARLLAVTESRHEAAWQNKADYTVRYWLGGVLAGESEEKIISVQENWMQASGQLKNQQEFEQWAVDLFFELSWGELGSAEFALKQALFEPVLAQQGPVALRHLVHQAQLGLDAGQLGRSQRFSEKWLDYWAKQDIDQHLDELQLQFEMMQRLGLHYPESVSNPWLITLDQSAQLLTPYLQDDKEFELELIQNRLAQVAGLIGVYRYGFAKDYLRSSYQQLPIASGQELSPSQEVFFELGKLLAQRIEYAQLTFEGAALPIDEEQFTRFVVQSKQSDLLSNDLEAFLEVEEGVGEQESPSFLPTLESALEILQLEGLALNETNIELSEEDPFAFKLNQAQFKDLDEVERSFDALYFPLNNTFAQIVIEGEPITGVFKLADLSRALSLPQLLESQGQPVEGSDFSDLFESSVNQGDAQARLAEELARQLAFNQLRQSGFNLPGPQVIRMIEGAEADRVLVLGAGLDWPEMSAVTFTFELHTTRQKLYQVQNSATQELYFDELTLAEANEKLFELIQRRQVEEQILIQFYQALEGQPVAVSEESIRFLGENLLQVTQITLNDLKVSFNAIFDAEKGKFMSLSHPLHSVDQVGIEAYIPGLMQAYIDDFLTQNDLPVSGNWNLKEPFNRVKVSSYELGDETLAFTLNLEKGVFENVQVKSSGEVIGEVGVGELRGLIEAGSKILN